MQHFEVMNKREDSLGINFASQEKSYFEVGRLIFYPRLLGIQRTTDIADAVTVRR